MATATQRIDLVAERRDAFAERVLASAAGAFDLFAIYFGDQLGFYEVLANDGPLTPAQLAARTGTHERYVREWLEQQATSGIVGVEGGAVDERRFYLPAGHDEVLADRESLNYLAPLGQLFAGGIHALKKVLRAYRTGGGVSYGDYGTDLVEGQARMNRAMFLKQLGSEWLPSIPDVHARLQAGPPASVADIGCGAGWSSIGLALSYPKVRVDGFDLDAPSIELARANAQGARVSERVRFAVRDAGDPELAGQYDLAMALECIHDMSKPVAALRAMRRLLKPGGAVLVVDERTAERFTPDAGVVERLLYGFSVFHCLPVGMAEEPSAGTGTVMRPGTLQRYAEQAGFREVEILPIDHFMFRFYRLHG